MIENWDKAFERVMKSEGGFVNHPSDPGGMTNLGVTKKNWENWVKHPVDEAEMRGLTHEKVKPFYKANYWDPVKGDELPSGIDYLTFDFAVNAGVGRAAKILQFALGTTADGVIGKGTIGVALKADPDETIRKFSEEKEKFYKSLPTFGTFGKGWLNRVAEAKDLAESMVA